MGHHKNPRALQSIDRKKGNGRIHKERKRPHFEDVYFKKIMSQYKPPPPKQPEEIAVDEALKACDKKPTELNEVTRSFIEIRRRQKSESES